MPLTEPLSVVPDRGTPESAWFAARELRGCRPFALPKARRAIVLAPHPDDEVLGAGGIMRALSAAGCDLTIIAITDGEASHPKARDIPPELLASRRAAERAEALRTLGVDAKIVRVGCPDGGVANAPWLTARLVELIRGADWCLSPWEHDGHPDHDATGRAAWCAAASVGVPLARYPIWAWHWATPGTDDLPWAHAQAFALDEAARDAKRAAIRAYRSQIGPLAGSTDHSVVLPPEVLAHFHRPFEVVFA